jgi:ornithine carbamoyltransferase
MASPRQLLVIDDVSRDELNEILDRSQEEFSTATLTADGHPLGVALIFEKPSLRTRNACEMAVVQLGGYPVAIFDEEIRLGKRESVADVTRVLAGYYSVLAARVFEHEKVEQMAAVSACPVINLLSDFEHPCQALADLLTIRQEFDTLEGRSLAWVGDFSNVARSLCIGAAMLGMSIRIGSPPGYGPSKADLDRIALRAYGSVSIDLFDRPETAVIGADVVSTDTWYSMGQESEKEQRARAFEGYCVTSAMMRNAGERAIFMHCLPAHRGEEVTDEVMDGPSSRVFPQAHNRMHAFRGLLRWLFD